MKGGLCLYSPFWTLYSLFVAFPVSMFIHELGHAFFVRVFGGKVTGIGFGYHNEHILFRWGKFYVSRDRLFEGRTYWEFEGMTVGQRLFISMGGILFNVITASALWGFGNPAYADFYRGIIIFSYFIALIALLPTTYKDGIDSDGLAAWKLIRRSGAE